MSPDKLTYVLVGLFVAVLGTGLSAGVLWLGAGGPRPDYEVYQTYIPESVYGLSKDAAVTYRRCVDTLHQSGVLPAPETEALRRTIAP